MCVTLTKELKNHLDLLFNTETNNICYPDGIEEPITRYLTRKERFKNLEAMQREIERLKILYQNPCCCSENELYKTKNDVRNSIARLWKTVF